VAVGLQPCSQLTAGEIAAGEQRHRRRTDTVRICGGRGAGRSRPEAASHTGAGAFAGQAVLA
jgi:hypothetical protein